MPLLAYYFIGLLLLIVAYIFARKWLKTKIRCLFIYPDKRQRSAFIEPNAFGMLPYKDGLYMYDPHNVLYSSLAGVELVPTLTFHYGYPSSVDIWTLRTTEGLKASSLARAWNDKSMEDFFESTKFLGDVKKPMKWGAAVVIFLVVVGGYLAFGDQLVGMISGSEPAPPPPPVEEPVVVPTPRTGLR